MTCSEIPKISKAGNGGSAAEGDVDPRIADHNARIAYYLADVANARRDLSNGKILRKFVHLANQRIEDGERYVAEARFHINEIRKASMDPHEAYAEENKYNKFLERRVDELEKVLLVDHERYERTRTAVLGV